MKKRILWIDVLNITACIGVLILHVSNSQVHDWDGNKNLAFWWGLVTHTFSYWPVPVFLMLSGFNILSNYADIICWRDFYKKRINKTLVPFIIWSLIYSVPHIIQKKVVGGGYFRRIFYLSI